MLNKIIIALSITASFSVFANDISTVDPSFSFNTCYYNNDPHKFFGVSVDENGSESYVYNSDVVFYNHKSQEKVTGNYFKGELKKTDSEGKIYEICLKDGKSPYKLEKAPYKQ